MGKQRELFRVSIVRKGTIRKGSASAPCAVTELTSAGIGLTTDVPTASGDRIELAFDLTDRHRISCALLVTHAAMPRVGGCIAEISDEHRQQLMRYIEDHAAISVAVC
ncbi:MAG: PilZ domain-containing protein [Nitrospiraceae bacterium]